MEGLDCGLFSAVAFGRQPAEIPSFDIDVRDVTVRQLQDFDAVVHLAGISNDPVGDLNPDCTYEINYAASVRLANLAKDAGVRRFLFASSCSLYGAAAGSEPLNEQASFDPVTAYGESKVMVEKEVAQLADHQFCPTYLRCATAYGVSPRLRADVVVNNLVGHAFVDGEVRMTSDGSPWRPLAHIEDISRAYLAILNAPVQLVHNQAFNVGRSGENYQIKQIARMVQDTVPGSTIRMSDQAGPDLRCYQVDCSKLERTLPEYRPQWTVRRGTQELYEAYKRYETSAADFHGPAYVRIRQIKALQAAGRLAEDLRWITDTAELALSPG